MSVDVKAVVMTKNKDVFKVSEIIHNAIIEKMYKESGIDGYTLWHRDLGYSYPQIKLHTHGMLSIDFEYKKEHRSLSVFFTCNGDYSNELDGELMNGSKIILSLGAYGYAVELIETCLDPLSKLGWTYLTPDDCADIWRFYK